MHHNPSPKILALSAGDFGAAVIQRLAGYHQLTHMDLLEVKDQLTQLVVDYDYLAVASWRPYVGIFQQLDDLCFEHNIRMSIADLSGQLLRCGPLIVPGHGACYHCYHKRLSSHHKAVERENVIEASLERNPLLGVEGFIQPLVEIAANGLAEDATCTADKASRFRLVDILASSVRESHVIGVHHCQRCRPKPPSTDQRERFIAHMQPELEKILE